MRKEDVRFKGIASLLGDSDYKKVSESHVVVCGVGGVGSWVVEGLIRTGIKRLTLIDMDEVCLSNTNRQIHALTSSVGQSKIEVLKKRCLDINPDCEIELIFDFLTEENLTDLIPLHTHFIVDAIDNARVKAMLIKYATKKKIPFLVMGASGGKLNPQKIKIAPLYKTYNDRLLKRIRKILRHDYGFEESARVFRAKTVFSDELALYPDGQGGVCINKSLEGSDKLDCMNGLGSASFVTGVFAFHAVHFIVQKLRSRAH